MYHFCISLHLRSLQNVKLPAETQASLCSGALAGIVWETIRSKWAESLPVVSACAALVERVGWPRAEGLPWVQDLFALRR